jgi:hypothetical protein
VKSLPGIRSGDGSHDNITHSEKCCKALHKKKWQLGHLTSSSYKEADAKVCREKIARTFRWMNLVNSSSSDAIAQRDDDGNKNTVQKAKGTSNQSTFSAGPARTKDMNSLGRASVDQVIDVCEGTRLSICWPSGGNRCRATVLRLRNDNPSFVLLERDDSNDTGWLDLTQHKFKVLSPATGKKRKNELPTITTHSNASSLESCSPRRSVKRSPSEAIPLLSSRKAPEEGHDPEDQTLSTLEQPVREAACLSFQWNPLSSAPSSGVDQGRERPMNPSLFYVIPPPDEI